MSWPLRIGDPYRLPDGRTAKLVGEQIEYTRDSKGRPYRRPWLIFEFEDGKRKPVNPAKLLGSGDEVEVEIELTDG